MRLRHVDDERSRRRCSRLGDQRQGDRLVCRPPPDRCERGHPALAAQRRSRRSCLPASSATQARPGWRSGEMGQDGRPLHAAQRPVVEREPAAGRPASIGRTAMPAGGDDRVLRADRNASARSRRDRGNPAADRSAAPAPSRRGRRPRRPPCTSAMQRFSRPVPTPPRRRSLVTSTMLIQASFWPSGRTSELACHLPSGAAQPKPRPAPSMKRQSATFWFQPASIDSGHTASLCSASIGAIVERLSTCHRAPRSASAC